MHHRHLRNQDRTEVYHLIDRYMFAYTIFLLHEAKASQYQNSVTGR